MESAPCKNVSKSEESQRRNRSVNFSNKDLAILIEQYEKYHSILDAPFSTKISADKKSRAWISLLDDFNAIASKKRNLDQLKTKLRSCWRLVNIHQTNMTRSKTGGGPPPPDLPETLAKLATLQQGSARLEGIGVNLESGNMPKGDSLSEDVSDSETRDQTPSAEEQKVSKSAPIYKQKFSVGIQEQQLQVLLKQEVYLDLKIKYFQEKRAYEIEKRSYELEEMQFEREKMAQERLMWQNIGRHGHVFPKPGPGQFKMQLRKIARHGILITLVMKVVTTARRQLGIFVFKPIGIRMNAATNVLRKERRSRLTFTADRTYYSNGN
uniref:Regulatory protein zeste n=1 Tax=Romanomermis culicivorax TaxID=13658 RepID=A0A915II58_ROMCU